MKSSGLLLLVACIIFASMKRVCQADDFFLIEDKGASGEDEEAETDEVEYPGGKVTVTDAKPRVIPRDPFKVKIFDQARMNWREPIHEKELMDELGAQLKKSWHETVTLDLDDTLKHPTSMRIEAGNLKRWHITLSNMTPTQTIKKSLFRFFSRYVNPTNEPITAEEEDLIDLRVDELRKHEGLLEDHMPLNFGYISRGKPMDALNSLMTELAQLRSASGERELAEEIAANRERPLLFRKAREKEAAEKQALEEKIAADNIAADKFLKEDRAAIAQRLKEKAAQRMLEAEMAAAERSLLAEKNRLPKTSKAGPAGI